MFKFSHAMLIALSGLIWFFVGIYLLPLGIHFLIDNGLNQGPLMSLLSSLDIEEAGLILVAIGLAIGYFKGKHVFAKTVEKNVDRIRALPAPASLHHLYTVRYIVLLGTMILIGLSMRWFNLPLDVRGFIDVAVGSALINGSMLYFRKALLVRDQAL